MNRVAYNILLALIAIAAVLITGFWCFADAATYYVRKDGNNSCNGTVDAAGSSGNCAKLTIQAGVNLAGNPGDTVTIHAGSYSETPTTHASGSAGNYITIQAYSGDTVTLTSMTVNHNYNIIKGLTFTGDGTGSNVEMTHNGNHNQIIYNTFLGNVNCCTYGEGGSYGIQDEGSGSNFIDHNVFDGQNNGNATAICIAIYMQTTTSGNQITYNTIKNDSTPGRLFEIYGANHVIAHNEVYGTSDQGCSSQVHVDLFQGFASSSSNILVEYNYFHDLNSQFVMLADDPADGGTQGIINHWTFRNNIYANIQQAGFIKSEYIVFYNNTFYNVGPGAGTNPLLWSTDSEGWGDNGAFINNIMITTANQGVGSDGTTIANNYWGTPTYGAYNAPEGTNYVNGGNPQFVAPYSNCITNTCNFAIGSTSIVIDKGQTISSFSDDYIGTSRPQGAAWDIGAYEYSSGTTTYTVSTSAGTNCASLSCVPSSVASGGTSVCTNTPNPNYYTSSMSGCGTPNWISGNVYSPTITGNCTVTSVCTANPATQERTFNFGSGGNRQIISSPGAHNIKVQ